MDTRFIYELLVNGLPFFVVVYLGNLFLGAMDSKELFVLLSYLFSAFVGIGAIFGILSSKTQRDIEKSKFRIDAMPEPFSNK